jgi:hypothetical protein
MRYAFCCAVMGSVRIMGMTRIRIITTGERRIGASRKRESPL